MRRLLNWLLRRPTVEYVPDAALLRERLAALVG